MGGHGHRNMYYLTGLPGWMRFGFSPGWVGRSPYGLGPAAQYLMYGYWPTPQMNYYMQPGYVPEYGYPYAPYGAPMTPEQELDMLKGEAEILEDELDGIKKRIEELEKENT